MAQTKKKTSSSSHKKSSLSSRENKFALASFLTFVLAFGLKYQGVLTDSFTSLLIVFGLFVLGTFFLQRYKHVLPMAELSFLILLYISLFIEKSIYFSDVILGILNPTLFAVLGFICIKLYDIKLEYSFKQFKKIAIIFGVSLLFAYLFLLMNEPFPSFVQNSFFILLIYTFFVSLGEEIVFRGASYSLVKRNFSQETSVHVQAAIFTIIHLLSITTLYSFYAVMGGSLILKDPATNVLIYAVALYGFAIIAARYAKGDKHTNIAYPIYFHWLVNFLNLAMLMI